MSGEPIATGEIEALKRLDLEALRTLWQSQYGPPPALRSTELLRLCLAWRLQAQAYGGLDRNTRRRLAGKGRTMAEGLELGVGTKLVRQWRGKRIEVVVTRDGFLHDGTTYPSLSSAATAIAGTRWNGPRFFGMRDNQR